ncbi:cysteine synthase A [Alteromonas gilva]|uniref:Cysteine synthase n=1 Tax=Alteromonas gilva TaxID=2987522 RepID=A0ABT5L5Q2_9ALTE|nr:cysteine synthase A [Alteromonas gilva]MDC8832384.1 cysteine synthase A [Alteromonas gilva]
MLNPNITTPIRQDRVLDSVVETIGNTPMVKLNRIHNGTSNPASILAKLEYFNPAGSIKDRAALAMLNALQQDNQSPVTHIVEASSGNSGVACAWLGAVYDIAVTIVMPEHMSVERQKLISHYGATLITTPREQGMPGAIARAERLIEQLDGAVSMDQFANPANALAHQQSTGQEIWDDTAGKVDVVVAGMGTGGTLTGIGTFLKARNRAIQIVAAEPESCPLLSQGRGGEHKIQGINPGHIPAGMKVEILDRVITVSDDDAISMARQLARKEGLAVGLSSGAVVHAALCLAAMPQYHGKNIVTILADGAERYFSTALFCE